MEDYEHITNIDEYIGFIYGIISSDHDIEMIFIDSILKHADVSLGDLPEFCLLYTSYRWPPLRGICFTCRRSKRGWDTYLIIRRKEYENI